MVKTDFCYENSQKEAWKGPIFDKVDYESFQLKFNVIITV